MNSPYHKWLILTGPCLPRLLWLVYSGPIHHYHDWLILFKTHSPKSYHDWFIQIGPAHRYSWLYFKLRSPKSIPYLTQSGSSLPQTSLHGEDWMPEQVEFSYKGENPRGFWLTREQKSLVQSFILRSTLGGLNLIPNPIPSRVKGGWYCLLDLPYRLWFGVSWSVECVIV
jgi:hypothetical protein